jgi:6-phosphogluconolactonase
LYVDNLNSSTVSAFLIDGNSGALTPLGASPFPTGQTPIPLIADPNGKFVYAGNHMGNSVTAYNVNDANGALSPVGAAPSSAGACSVSCHVNPMRLAIDPADQFLYVTNVGNNSVAAFRLTNGVLSPASSPVATGQHPFGVALDPSGKFLFVANKVDNTISVFTVNSTATLSPFPGSPFSAGGNGPTNIVIVKAR